MGNLFRSEARAKSNLEQFLSKHENCVAVVGGSSSVCFELSALAGFRYPAGQTSYIITLPQNIYAELIPAKKKL